MKYKSFIEDYFLIDEPKSAKLVPFHFNQVQSKYYDILCELGIEQGLNTKLREFILKARREGFSSLILALFAADDILQSNPTESMVISYKDDATSTFRKRYRRYVLSYFAQKSGIPLEDIQHNSNILESISKQVFSIYGSDVELKHNGAHFYCGTAAARTGGRGGVLQKLLFTEPAHYQDTEKMTAKEIIEGTSQQVDKQSGWIFQESTANGKGNYYYQTYEAITRGTSSYKKRFFGWPEFYTPEQFAEIAAEFTDPDMLLQEYPKNEEEAFLSANLSFTSQSSLLGLVATPANKSLEVFLEFSGTNYIDQAEIIKDFLITYEKTHPNKNIYAGLDTAKNIDRTVLTILLENELVASGGIKGLAIDSTGQGDFMPDWFERNSKWYLHRVPFTRPSKSTMFKNLSVVIQDKLTTLPSFLNENQFISDEWKHFYKQMLDLQKKIIGNLLVVSHPTDTSRGKDYYLTPHDDYPDSWALAELVYIVVNGVPEGKRPPDESHSFDTRVRNLLQNSKTLTNVGNDDYV